MNINLFMDRAVSLSRESLLGGGGPFGAIIVKEGEIIGEGMNRVVPGKDPTAHAEIVAIRNACNKIGSQSLSGSEIYTSCEPCPMCLGAIYWAGIKKIYYSNSRKDAEEIGFIDNFIYEDLARNLEDRTVPIIKIEVPEAKKVFGEWKTKTDKIDY
jgi:tRNA(Arg) A34 adenosine deaminase TadA